jgi:eukaryotic-like serine/threonine-protein kinase
MLSKTLSHFEILERIGAGGMGEVYRARDSQLNREVALKVLPEAFADDPERLSRFDREAKALASLNHPSIAAIHGIGEAEGIRFLVLELVPGVTLAERLLDRAFPLGEALQISLQIAEALATAHEKGIVHRDLKPANVKLTPDGRVKVLDFGVAKALAKPATPGEQTTRTSVVGTTTAAGSIVGTPLYMSPEQARGLAVDARSDLWAFGCLLCEILSRRHPFARATAADTTAAILGAEPDLSALPVETPAGVRDLLAWCLRKDPSQRARDARAAAAVIEAVLRGPRGQARPTPRLTQVTLAEAVEEFPAWSPDGKEIVYAREVGALRKIFRQPWGGGDATQITHGDHDDIVPAWSPDGATILFARGREAGRRHEPGDVFGQDRDMDVWSLDLATGREHLLIQGACNPAWSPDGSRIAVDAAWAGPDRIWIVDRKGRNPRQASTDTSEAVAHLRPRWSPDGELIAYHNMERTKFDIRVLHVDTGRFTSITSDTVLDVHPSWSASGRHLYFSSYRSGGINIWRIPVGADGSPAGALEQITTGAGQDVEAALSPDGSRMAFATLRQNADIWRLPVDPKLGSPTGPPEKVLATTREESRGAWSPDGSRIAFNSDRAGDMNIWLFSSRDRSVRQLTRGPGGDYQPNWSPDARTVVFFSSRSGSPAIWTADVESGDLRRVSEGHGIEINPFYSPDGGRIAYQSDRDGRLEVWVMDSDGGRPRQLTTVGVGGHFLRWTPDGRWIIFRSTPLGKTLRVPADGGEPEPLPDIAGGAHMSLSPDAARIMDVVEHKALWVSPLDGGAREKVFEFQEPGARIDYPVWSPDGRWVLFDRFQPQGGDIWVMENFE